MSVLNVRGIEESLMRRVKVEVASRGMKLREWVIWVLEAQVNGDDERGAKGGSGEDSGKATDDGGREGGSEDAEKPARGVRTADIRVPKVRVVRAGVQDGRERVDGDATILRSRRVSQRESGAVRGGAQADTGGKRAGKARKGIKCHKCHSDNEPGVKNCKLCGTELRLW